MIIYGNIKERLKNDNIPFDEIDHEVSHSCEESKNFRDAMGLEGLGSKNIVFHARGRFYLVVTHGNKQIKARNFKHEFNTKDIRFASQDEIDDHIGAKIGSIPPFGFSNKEIPIYVDSEILENKYFMFNPGDPKKTIRILSSDLVLIFLKLGNPVKYFIHTEESFEIIQILTEY